MGDAHEERALLNLCNAPGVTTLTTRDGIAMPSLIPPAQSESFPPNFSAPIAAHFAATVAAFSCPRKQEP